MIVATVNSRVCTPPVASLAPRHPPSLRSPRACANAALLSLGQRVGLDDLVHHQLGRFSACGGAAVGVLLDGVADIPQPGERGIAWQVEAGDGALGRPSVTGDRDVEDPGAFLEALDLVAK